MIPTLETEQGAELKRQLQEVGKIVQNYHTNMRLAKEQQHREAYYAALARNAAAQQQQVQVTGTGPSLAVPVPIQSAIHDPEEITRSQSTAPAAHVDPGPASWPPIRPTLNGGFPAGLQHGTPSSIQPPADDPSIFVPDIRPTSLRKNQGAEQHVRKKIQELVATVDANVKVDAEAEDLLLEIADEFIDSVANFASRLAKHRNNTELELRDLQLHLEMHHGIRIPGFSADPPSQLHHHGLGSQGASGTGTGSGMGGGGMGGGGGGGGGAGGGGAKKSGGGGGGGVGGGGGGVPGNAGSSANVKRTSRLAAVNQAKKDSRLL
ncbi:Transcription initiation factor TFIID subunit 12 [Serendipita sp. 397]|nr:Transcription initiation factor TFIID subunit 12 [Serendipita sp. 397]